MSDIVHDIEGVDVLEPTEKKQVSRRGRRVMATLLVLLIILLLIATFLLVQLVRPKGVADRGDLGGVTWVRSIYGYGPNLEEMTEPSSIAIDPGLGGAFWVTDQIRFRLVKYDEMGSMLQLFSGEDNSEPGVYSPGVIDYPSRLKIAPDGWKYVVQSTYGNVKVYDDEGAFQHELTVPDPSSVAVNDEMVIVGARSGFVAFDRSGELIGYKGTRGIGDEEFDNVNGVVLDDESNAYIVDTFNNRISKYDREGERVWMIETGPPGNRAGDNQMAPTDAAELSEHYPALMQAPMGATLDAAGRLIVIDLLDFSIAAFDTEDGTFLGKWGTWGQEDGKFYYPADIAYDEDFDWFLVADSGNRRAQIIRLPGSGGDAEAALRRALAGPLRACAFPFILLLILLISWIVLRKRTNRRTVTVLQQDDAGDVT